MKSVAFVFTQAPHGCSAGREGLDAALATAALCEQVSLFFIGDGVLQLTLGQAPEKILARNYIPTFAVLPLYDVERCYLCGDSLRERGMDVNAERVLKTMVVSREVIREYLAAADRLLVF